VSSVGAPALEQRGYIPIIGGTFSGPAIKGKVVPGGWDWQLQTRGMQQVCMPIISLQTTMELDVHVVNHGQFLP